MIKIRESFSELSQPIKCNRHLIPITLCALFTIGSFFILLSSIQRIGTLHIKTIQWQRGAKGFLIWGMLGLPIGLSQWHIANTNHSFATYRLPPSNTPYNTSHKLTRICRDIFSTLILPWGLTRLIHHLVGNLVNLSSRGILSQRIFPQQPSIKNLKDAKTHLDSSYERISIAMNDVRDVRIDGYIKHYSSKTNRYLLITLGTGCVYETFLGKILDSLSDSYKANIVIYNPPGIGESTGTPTKENLINSYSALHQLIEERGATHLISYSISLGGTVQNEAHKKIGWNPDIQYILIKDRVPISLASGVPNILTQLRGGRRNVLLNKVAEFSFRYFSGWNLKADDSSLLPNHVTEIFLHCSDEISETNGFREMDTYTEIACALSPNEGVIERDYACVHKMASRDCSRRRFFITGGNHQTVDCAFTTNSDLAHIILTSFS